MAQKKHRKKNITIGFITDWIEQRYQAAVYHGISSVLEKQNINLISFVIGSIKEPYEFIAQRNVIADLINPAKLDGLIVMSGALSNYVDYQELISFIEKYQPLPMTSIGIPIAGFPSVLVDNKEGMKEALIHLIETHGFTRIAFIRGPRGHREAEERYQAYQDVLLKYDIPINSNLILNGDFYWTSGATAIYELLKIRKQQPQKDFEAVVASNDFMALSALEALIENGIRVPDEVAIVGFDDIEETTLVLPPLTTVAQPLEDLGKHAAEMLLSLLSGSINQKTMILPTRLVVRGSCGCFSYNIQQIKTHDIHVNKKNRVHPSKRIVEIIQDTLAVPPDSLPADWAQQLLNCFYSDVYRKSDDSFISLLDFYLRNMRLNKNVIQIWHKIITILYQYTLPEIEKKPKAMSVAAGLYQQTRILIDEFYQRMISNQTFLAERCSIALSQFNASLITTFKIPVMMETITRELLRLNIQSAYLVLYSDTEKGAPSEWSRLVLAYDEYEQKDLEENGRLFPSNQLLPDNILSDERTYALAVFPLFVEKMQLGYVLFEVEPEIRKIYETLRYQISSALKGAIYFTELQQTAKELARSNAELEQFAYIASHDLQEPLRTIASYAQLLKKKITKHLDDDTALFLFYLIDGSQRMQTMIRDLLTYSRVSSQKIFFKQTNLNKILSKVAESLSLIINEKDAQVQWDSLPEIVCDPVQIERLFQNLVGNALKFCKNKPRVSITAAKKEKTWQISIKDNGIGIDREYIDDIFGIFKRLHRRNEYSGTGIGLSICKKIVEQHGGEIWVESKEKEGSVFNFTIPVQGR